MAKIWDWNDVRQARVLGDATTLSGAAVMAKARKWAPAAVTPSATANTDGTGVTMSPSTGENGFGLLGLGQVVFGGTFGSETVTATFTVTFSDATTATVTVTATATGTTALTAANLLGLHKDNVYIKNVVVKAKSTISSSAATATATLLGVQN